MSRVKSIAGHGQSIWLDYIDRPLLDEGVLARMVEEDALAGVTSNPAIFQKAITSSDDYASVLDELAGQSENAKALYEAVAIRDIQDAADVLAEVYKSTQGRDGYVSLEVSPDLARDTHGTIDEARRLWTQVARPNLMVKVPGTAEGMEAIETLIAEGINVNVTLLFARSMYERTAEAYIAGLERRVKAGESISSVASVASFFISRIDSAVDKQLKASNADSALLGKTAIANGKLAYQHYESLMASERWGKLKAAGAMPQRLLWASTSTKDPSYRDVLYIEELIGPDTVNTVPPATLDAFRDHGEAANALVGGVEQSEEILASVADAGVDLDAITDQLLDDGIVVFADAFQALLAAVDSARLEHS